MDDATTTRDAAGSETAPSILSKAFLVLDSFTPVDRVLTLTEIAERSGLAKSTVHRLLRRLCELGAIESTGDKFRIGIRLVRLTSSMPASALLEHARPLMVRLAAWAEATVSLAVLRGSQVVYIEEAGSDSAHRTRPGERVPAHVTAAGKVMLAQLAPEELDETVALDGNDVEGAGRDKAAIDHELKSCRARKLAFTADKSGTVNSVAAPIMINRRPGGAITLWLPRERPMTDSIASALVTTSTKISTSLQEFVDRGHDDWVPRPAKEPRTSDNR